MLSAAAGCARNARPSSEEAVRVEDVRLRFESGERGEVELSFSARSPALQAGAYTEVTWELWLGGRWFAAGTQAMAEPAPTGQPHTFRIRAPLVFRRTQPADEAPTPVDVAIRGAVALRAPGGERRLPFEDVRLMRVPNLPEVGAGTELED